MYVRTCDLSVLRARAAPSVPRRRQTAHKPFAVTHDVGRKLGYGYSAKWNRTSTPVRSQMFELIQSVRRLCVCLYRAVFVFGSRFLAAIYKLMLANPFGNCVCATSVYTASLPFLTFSHYLKRWTEMFADDNTRTNSANFYVQTNVK